MSQAPLMPVFTDALIGDTTFLSAEEFGAYCLLLFATWRNNGKAFADDDRKLSRICRVTERRWREKVRPTIEVFFDISDGYWHQKRLEKEWIFATIRAEKSRENGLHGGRPKSLNSRESENPAGSFWDNLDQTQTEPSHYQDQIKELPPKEGGRQNAPNRRAVAESMIQIWKDELGGILAAPTKATPDRIALANTRFADEFGHDLELWRGFCQSLRGKPFLVGDNKQRWRCDFDWCLNPKNILKVTEGKYDDRDLPDSKLNGHSMFDTGPTEPPPTVEGFELPLGRAH